MAGLLAKSGKDSINIAGHKVPIALLAGGVALVGVIVVLRARSQAGQVASVGQAPATAADTGFGLGAPIDYGPAIANLSQQLTALAQTGINGTSPGTSPGTAVTVAPAPGDRPTPTPPPPTNFGMVTSDIGGGYIYSTPGGLGGSLLGFFTGPLKVLGPAVAGPAYGSSSSPGLVGVSSNEYIPVQYGGQTGYLWAPEAHINN